MKSQALVLITSLSLLLSGCCTKPKKIYEELRPCTSQKASCSKELLAQQEAPAPLMSEPADTNVTETSVIASQADQNRTDPAELYTSRYHYLAQNDLETVSRPIIEKALEEGIDINTKDREGKHLLSYARQLGNVELIAYLIQKGFDLSQEPQMLLYAYEKDNIYLAKLLIEKNYRDEQVGPLLEDAVADAKSDWIALLRGIGAVTKEDRTAFRKAVDRDDIKMADELIAQGFKLSDDPMLLTYAVRKKRDSFVKYLVSQGYDLNSDKDLLNEVIVSGDYTLADYLIEHGTEKVFRPELIASAHQSQNLDLINFLIFHGVPMHFTPQELNRALQESNLKYAELIIRSGVKAETEGVTPFTQAAQQHNVKVMDLLLRNGQDINEHDGFGRTALMYLADDINLSAWLIKKGAAVNAKDQQGRTPLMYASLYIPVAALLIEHGADVTVKDRNEFSILNYAVEQNNIPLAKLILPFDLPLNEEDLSGKRILSYSKSIEMTRLLMKYKARY